jgi:outer membrane protein, multidrug efflux system
VRRAECELTAANAHIGIATADLFPRLVLAGNVIGLQSAGLSDVFPASSRFWRAGPIITRPIFDTGRLGANIQVQNAQQGQMLAQYEKAVLTAFGEVENALVAFRREQMRHRALAVAVDANRQAVT